MTLSVGEQLGTYEILAPLGAGGMGEVYRARDPRLGRDVAIKVLPAAATVDPDRLRRFEQEARATGQLNHPNIVAVHDIGTKNGTPFIVYELLEGQTLRERLRSDPLPTRKAIDYAIQICRGLAVAHAQGVVHRDLKPENVFLTRDGRIKILDFGLAKLKQDALGAGADSRKLTDKKTGEGVILGTVGYMAPEQVRGQPADHRADIFSLGAILYEMVGGKRSFRGDSDVETMNAILTQDPPPLSDSNPTLPPALSHVIEHSLEKDPGDRFQSVQDLAFDLELISTVSRSGGPGVDRRFAKSALTRRWVLVALGLLVAAVVGGVVAQRMMHPTEASGDTPIVVRRLTEFLGLENYPALSPDGRSVAFTADVKGRHQLWVRLMAGGPALQLTRDAADHQYPRWSRDSSSLVYFSPPLQGQDAGSIWEISAFGGAPRRLAESVSGADLSPTDDLAFFRLRSGKIELVKAKRDGSDPRVVTELERGYLYGWPRWSPDGKSIAYERRYHGSHLEGVFAVRTDQKKPRQLTSGGSVNGFAWLPDGSGIVYSSGRGSIMTYQETFHLWSARPDEKEPRQLTFGEASYVHPDVNRSGRIVTTRIRLGSDLWRFPVDGDGAANVRAATPVSRQTAEVRVPSASPSGREIVYLTDIGGHSNLWVMRLDTGEARQLTFETDPKIQVGIPLWSPDGRSIAFYWKGENDFGYSTMLPDGSGLRQVLSKGWWVCWSPDSRWLYYQDQQGPGRQLMKIPIDGGSPVVVRTENAMMPALSPDGATLYFIVEVPRATGAADFEIRSASPEDAPSRLVTRIAAHRMPDSGRFHPDISPDGRWLALPLNDGTTTNIWAVSTSDGAMRRITDFGDRPTFITRRVSWSPDGRSIYAAVSEGEADIVLFDGLRP